MKRIFIPLCAGLSLMYLLSGCSVKSLAVSSVANALTSTSSSTVFTGDDDPQFVGEALPVIIKIHESLAEAQPDNPRLLLATGKLCALYAYGFIQVPAREYKESDIDRYKKEILRTKRMFLRGRRYCLDALSVLHDGFAARIFSDDPDSVCAAATEADTAYLYWTAMAWMGAITADKNDFDLMITMNRAVSLMDRAYELNPDFSEGAIHEFYLSYYAGLPASMGGSIEKARHHFEKAVELSESKKVGPYLSMATSVAVKTQDLELFDTMLKKARSVPVDRYPQYRLVNTLHLQQAAWYEKHRNDLFLVTDDE